MARAKKKKADAQSAKTATFWVGIGASAGGLEALRAFVRQLPDNLDVTYIAAQHLSPHHRSMLPEIIGRETQLEVLSAEDEVVPLPNKVYITPQNRDIEIQGDRLRIVSPSRDAGTPKPSIDRFFHSLADQKGENAVGIILSGTGSDGSRGMRDIKAAGGTTIAQDEHSAKYTGMPLASVEAGCVDLVMSPEEIGSQFSVILERRANLSSLKASPVHLDSVSELIHLVHNRCRVNFRHYKVATLQRRIERRMAAIGVSEIEDYVSVARSSDKEIDALFKDFLISVTSFFRDPVEFETLRFHIKDLLAAKQDNQPIRVWVPGAATGEEVYTICMIFSDLMGGLEAFSRQKFQIFASDIDQDATEIARRGLYAETALDEVPRDFIDEYMEKVPTGYLVKKAIRERVVFSNHNLIQDPPFLNIDLISCRNVLIYFQTSLQSQVLSRFHYSLVPNGLLFLGKSETTAANESLFRSSDEGKHVYYQKPAKARTVFDDYDNQSRAYGPRRQIEHRPSDLRDVTTANARFDSLVRAFGPDGFLIGADLQLRKAYGNVNPYINVTSGSLSLGISALIREPFGQDIRTAAPMVIRKKEIRQGIAHPDPNDPTRRIRVTVYPIESGPDEEVMALALLSSWRETTSSTAVESNVEDHELAKHNEELRRELDIAQANLQQTSEELETSNEELQALNEELQSSNEELQSTNEELETSNEELQSTNEELSTVNEELQVNSNELRIVNQSLNGILRNVGLPLIVVDSSLNILHVSNASENLFDINMDSELPHLSLIKKLDGLPDMVELANNAMVMKKPTDIQVQNEKLNAVISIVPHMQDNGSVQGAVILIADNTEELVESKAHLDVAAQLSGLGHWRIDLVDDTLSWSPQIYEIHGVAPESYAPDLKSAVAFYHPDDVDRVRKHLSDAIEGGQGFGFEAKLVRPDGEVRSVKSVGRVNTNELGDATSVFGVFLDVTEDRERENALRATLDELSKSNEELNRFSYVCSHDMKEPVRLIQSLCELLLEPDIKNDTEQRDDLINRIALNTDRLATIISSLLAYSRIDEKVEFKEVDLNDVLGDVLDSLALSIQEADADIETAALPVVQGARVHFSQLFQNLIANALKFNDKAKAQVRISSVDGENGDAEIRVEDNGPGIKSEDRDSIFEVFKRLQRRDEVEGTGLGLSICQRIVAQYGGTITVEESDDLGGACFVVRLNTGSNG